MSGIRLCTKQRCDLSYQVADLEIRPRIFPHMSILTPVPQMICNPNVNKDISAFQVWIRLLEFFFHKLRIPIFSSSQNFCTLLMAALWLRAVIFSELAV